MVLAPVLQFAPPVHPVQLELLPLAWALLGPSAPVRTMKAQKMLQMKNIMFSLINLIVLRNLIMKIPKLNILVNDINSLDVKKIDDLELIRKILHSLQRPEYDLVTTILYEKELSTMTPNEILNKVIAHEILNDIKARAPPSSPTHSALTSKQERLLKKMAIKGSSSEEEESQCSSSDED